MQFSTEQKALLKALSLPTEVPKGAVDWASLLQKVQASLALILQILAQFQPKQGMCPDEKADCCSDCHQAGTLALNSAIISFTCCESLCVK